MATERWINAVITIRVPLDVDIGATDQEKLDAACDVSVQNDVLEAHGAEVAWELVEDGEPVPPEEE